MPRYNPGFQLVTENDPQSPVSEAYKSLRTNIEFANVDENIRVIAITSSVKGEGKSTTAANLAVACAQANKRTLLIDADLRAPTQHDIFRIPNGVGLTSLLSHQSSAQEVTVTAIAPNLFVIPAGPVPPSPSEMLASKRMSALLEEWKSDYDTIILDMPAVLEATDASILSAQCDGVLLVIDYGKVKKEAAVKAKSALDLVKARFLGVVLNNIRKMA